MVWSEQTGTSIILPSDRVAGDGRNYIVIGADVPTAISDHFTAALVFWNGNYNGPDPAAGNNIADANTDLGYLYPQGFVYYALGISNNNRFEIVSFYAVVPSPMSQTFITYRRTLLTIAPPTGSNSPPILGIGGGETNYETYAEGSSRTVSDYIFPNKPGEEDGVTGTSFLSAGVGQWADGIYKDWTYQLLPTGEVFVQGLARISNAASLVSGGAQGGYRITVHSGPYVPKTPPTGTAWPILSGGCQDTARLFDVRSDGIYIRGAAPATGNWVSISGHYIAGNRSFA